MGSVTKKQLRDYGGNEAMLHIFKNGQELDHETFGQSSSRRGELSSAPTWDNARVLLNVFRSSVDAHNLFGRTREVCPYTWGQYRVFPR